MVPRSKFNCPARHEVSEPTSNHSPRALFLCTIQLICPARFGLTNRTHGCHSYRTSTRKVADLTRRTWPDFATTEWQPHSLPLPAFCNRSTGYNHQPGRDDAQRSSANSFLPLSTAAARGPPPFPCGGDEQQGLPDPFFMAFLTQTRKSPPKPDKGNPTQSGTKPARSYEFKYSLSHSSGGRGGGGASGAAMGWMEKVRRGKRKVGTSATNSGVWSTSQKGRGGEGGV